MHLNEILDQMRFTWLHYLAFSVMSCANMLSAFNGLMASLLTTEVQHECRLIYPNETAVGNCEVFRNGTDHNKTVSCQYGYKYTFEKLEGTTNIVTQWDLVCDKKSWAVDAVSIYYSAGPFAAIISGVVSDLFGRRKVALFCLMCTLPLTWTAAFMTNFTAYITIRWFATFFLTGFAFSNYCLFLEILPTKRKPLFAAFFELSWGTGTLFTGFLGYIIRDWRWVVFAGNFLLVIMIIMYLWFIPESIQWLINNGKMKEAEKNFQSYIAKSTPAFRESKLVDIISPEDLTLPEKTKYNFTHLFRTRRLRFHTIGLTYCMVSVVINFWGIVFGSISVGEHPYINTIIGGTVEFIPYIANKFILARFSRRKPLMIYLLFTSVPVFIAGWLPRDIANGWIPGSVLLVARIANVGAYAILDIYSSELFPTNIRNLGMNHAGFWAMASEFTSPYVMQLSDFYYPLNYITFGAFCFPTLLIIFYMPETKGKPLLDTIEEIENLGKKQVVWNGASNPPPIEPPVYTLTQHPLRQS